MGNNKPRFIGPIVLIGGVLVILGLTAFVIRVMNKVRTGHGLDYYFTGLGVQFNYIGALILLGLVPICLLIGWGFRWWQLREHRDFRKKFNLPKESIDNLEE